MKTKSGITWNISLISLGCFLFIANSSLGMFGEEFDKAKADEAARLKARQQAEQQQRARDLTAPGTQGRQSSTLSREDLNSGNAPRENPLEKSQEEEFIRIISKPYFNSLTQKEEDRLVDEVGCGLRKMELAAQESGRVLTKESYIFRTSYLIAEKANIPYPATVADAVAAYQQAVTQLGSSLGLEGRPTEEILEISSRLREYELEAMMFDDPQLTEEGRINFAARIAAEIDARKAAALIATHHSASDHSIEEAVAATKRLSLGSTSSEGKGSHPSTPPGSIKKEHTDSDASDQLERLSKERHSDGSTSGEDSHHTTPEKRLPSAPTLPAMTEVERLQEEVRLAKEEMERAEDIAKNPKKYIIEAREKYKDAVKRSSNPSYYESKGWEESCSFRSGTIPNRAKGKNDDLFKSRILTSEEEKLVELWTDWINKNNITMSVEGRHRVEQLYAVARDHYLKLKKELYLEQKKANPSIAHSLALTLCERHISFVLHEIAQTEEQLLKYGKGKFGTSLKVDKCDSELSQIKEHILPLWNHYKFLARERYKTKVALTFPDPYISTEKEQTTLRQLQQELQTFKEALPRLKETFLSWQTRKSELEENLRQAFTETSRKLQLAVAQAKKAVDNFDRNHPVVGFGFTQRSRDLQVQQNALVATYNRAVREKNEYLNPSPGYGGYCGSASDHLSSSDLRAADREMQEASGAVQDQERKIRDQERKVLEFAEIINFHPELRGSEDVAYFKQPLQEQFTHYSRALNALITFDDSLPSMIDRSRPCGAVISREPEKHYEKYAPILITSKTSLLAPQEQGHPERFVAHGMSTSEIVKLALERKKEYDSHQGWAQRTCNGTVIPSYTPSYTREQAAQDWWRREGQQQAIQRSYNSTQQQLNANWNAQQNAMFFNSMNNGTYCPLPMYRR